MRTSSLLRRLAVASAALPLSAALVACGDDASETASETGADSTTEAPAGEGTTCEYPADEVGTVAKEVEPPPAEPTVSGEIPVTIATSVGDLALTLDADAAPCTVNSFVSLAEQGYYDGSECHRLSAVDQFSMLQCGDPTGTGGGGPGYTIPDELEHTTDYPAGTIAMAKRAEPDSGGGQFFLVFGDTGLPPEYTVFGTFDEATIQRLEAVGAAGHDDRYGDGTGFPTEKVVFESVRVG